MLPDCQHPKYWAIITLVDGSKHVDTTVSLILVDRKTIENHMLQEWDQAHPGQVESVEVLGHWFDGDGNEQPDAHHRYRLPTEEEIANAQAQANTASNENLSDQRQ